MGIVLKNIQKAFKGRVVLKDLNLRVEKGEFHVLLGPSGSGKTTVLSIMAGLIKQDHGQVFMGMKNVSHVPPSQRGIGFVFQDYALFPHLTVFENIAYGPRVRKLEQSKIKKRVEHYLRRFKLEKEKDKLPDQLSGGQKQRTAMARALVQDPEILLMDEPMSNLDPLTKERIGRELKALQHETGMTTVYVTHNQEEALLLGTTVSVLNDGRIEQMERAKDLFDHPKTEFVARFLGTNNILKASVTRLKQQEAIVHVHHERMKRPFAIRVKRYPLFDKTKKVDLCIHPGRLLLKKKDDAVDDRLNRIEGSITHIADNLHVVSVSIDVGGPVLHAAVPRERFSFYLHETIWVCFDPDAPHPLCGKSCREAEPLRKCATLIERKSRMRHIRACYIAKIHHQNWRNLEKHRFIMFSL
jgi:ABC-type Fe3+/spermidine/putrescine transport system ATPase subunit